MILNGSYIECLADNRREVQNSRELKREVEEMKNRIKKLEKREDEIVNLKKIIRNKKKEIE